MSKQILITKEKGGVASTTTAVNLAYDLASRGYSVLLVDMDTRGDCAPCLGLDPAPGLQKAIAGHVWGRNRDPFIADGGYGIHLLPTNTSSTTGALHLIGDLKLSDVAEILVTLGDEYDYVIYDTSAASGKLRQAAMMIADLMVIPTKLEALGMADIGELIAAFGRPLQVIILPVAYDKRLGVHQYNLGVLQERFGYAGAGGMLAGVIPYRVAVMESQHAMRPVLDSEPDNDASFAYRRFTDAVIEVLNGDWGEGSGEWGIGETGIGIGDRAFAGHRLPNPQSPVPNPYSRLPKLRRSGGDDGEDL